MTFGRLKAGLDGWDEAITETDATKKRQQRRNKGLSSHPHLARAFHSGVVHHAPRSVRPVQRLGEMNVIIE